MLAFEIGFVGNGWVVKSIYSVYCLFWHCCTE